MQRIDELCARLDRLAEQQLAYAGGQVVDARHEELVTEMVQIIQRIGEGIAWAYNQQHKRGLGELFAQPFVDRRTRDRLKALLCEYTPKARMQGRSDQLRNRVAAQILQTIHILLQATPADSTLFCNLNAGWYLNDVVAAPFDFRENEDFLPLWMTVVKDLAAMLNTDNMMLFFDPSAKKPFPLFTEAVRFYHHPTAQVRTHVQAISLDVFLKLRDESVWTEPLFSHVMSESTVFFTHVCCLLREFWIMVDEGMRLPGSRREVRNALSIQNDILVYVSDVLSCEVPPLAAALQEKLLRFAVFPVLVRSVLRGGGEGGGPALASTTAAYLLGDVLSTIGGSAIPSAVAFAMLRPQVPEEVPALVAAPPPRTPLQYFDTQKLWHGESGGRPGGPFFDGLLVASDDKLYAMPPQSLIRLLDSPPLALVHNNLLEVLEAEIRALATPGGGGGHHATPGGGGGGASGGARGTSLLASAALALRTLRGTGEALAGGVAERLCAALSNILGAHRRVHWTTLDAAIGVLRELAAAADSPPGRSGAVLGPILRERVLRPLSGDILQDVRHMEHGPALELWLQEFEEQWRAHLAPPPEATAESRLREFVELSPPRAKAPEGRASCLRVLLAVRRLAFGIQKEEMPGVDEFEVDENKRFQSGSSIHVGKMNRVKCHVRGAGRSSAEIEPVYLMPARASVLLVRPDETKPFWAVPVVAEPLRTARLDVRDENSGSLEQLAPPGSSRDEQQRPLRYEVRLEVIDPRSPLLRKFASGSKLPAGVGLVSGYPGVGDRLAATVTGPSHASVGNLPGGMDRFAHTVPAGNLSAFGGAAAAEEQHATPACSFSLLFTDERRRRVACKVLVQTQYAVQARAVAGVTSFLSGIRDGA